jgi:anthranilate synthase/aminodeoxychorismate synthase-like glutamine amidotransferase
MMHEAACGTARRLCATTPPTLTAAVILLIDNYDSFTYNLVQRIGEIDHALDVRVVRNDQITVDEAAAMNPSHLILSPGPCTPSESGVCGELIEHFRGRIPILGVCLGHQTIADRHGMTVRRHSVLMHGKTSPIHHDNRGVFRGMSNPFIATRYHSLIVDRATLSEEFEVSAWTEAGEIMGIRWRGEGAAAAPMEGVQFHPESFLTVEGPTLLANFLRLNAPHAFQS